MSYMTKDHHGFQTVHVVRIRIKEEVGERKTNNKHS